MKQCQLASPPSPHQPVVQPNSWPTQKGLRTKVSDPFCAPNVLWSKRATKGSQLRLTPID